MTPTTEVAKQLTPAQLRKRIRDRERRFKQASASGKRVMIARDVLAQLDYGLLKAKSGTWFDAKSSNYSTERVNNGMDFRDALVEKAEARETCSACALGSLFVCAVMRADELPAKSLRTFELHEGGLTNVHPRFSDIHEYLSKFFSEAQLRLIEIAFEMGGGQYRVYGDDAEEYDASVFADRQLQGARYDDRLRMIAVMKNIIANKGEFKP